MPTPTVSDDDIRAYSTAWEHSPDMIAQGMQRNNVSMADMARALNKTPEQIGAYVQNSGNPWLQEQYNAWRSPPATSTGAGPGAGPGASPGGQPTTQPPTDRRGPPDPSTRRGGPNDINAREAARNAPMLPAPAPAPAPSPMDGMTSMLQDWFTSYMREQRRPPRAQQAQPSTWTVNPSQTTQGIIQSLTSQDSPVLQQARERALQEANARGMLNTSSAINAADQALYDRASMIAATDANLYGQAASQNAQASTQVSMFNAGQQNEMDTSHFDRLMSGAQFGLGLAERARESNLDFDIQQRQLAESARQANLSSSTTLQVAGMNYDIQDRRLSQEDRQFVQTHALASRQLDAQIAQFAQRLGLDARALDNEIRRTDLQNTQFYAGLSQQDQHFASQLQLGYAQLAQQGQQFNQEWQNRFSLQSMEQQGRIDIANIDVNARMTLAQMDREWRTDIARNEIIGNAWGATIDQIGRLQNNPDLEPTTRDRLIQNTLNSFGAFARYQRDLSGGNLNIDGLLNFGIVATPGSNSSGGNQSGVTGQNSNGTPDIQSPGGP